MPKKETVTLKIDGTEYQLPESVCTTDELVRQALAATHPDINRSKIERTTTEDGTIITITKLPGVIGPMNTEPEDPISILRSIIAEAGGQLPDDLATMYPSESGHLELHFENEILSRVRTSQGQYLFDTGTPKPDYASFMRLLQEQFIVEVLREKLDGHSPEGRKAACLGPILAITHISLLPHQKTAIERLKNVAATNLYTLKPGAGKTLS